MIGVGKSHYLFLYIRFIIVWPCSLIYVLSMAVFTLWHKAGLNSCNIEGLVSKA